MDEIGRGIKCETSLLVAHHTPLTCLRVPKDIRVSNIIDPAKDRITLVALPGSTPVIAEENARSVLIISIKNQQRLFRTSPQAAAVVPVHNAAAAAWGMIDERVEHRRHLRPMHKVCADCVA